MEVLYRALDSGAEICRLPQGGPGGGGGAGPRGARGGRRPGADYNILHYIILYYIIYLLPRGAGGGRRPGADSPE